MTLAQAREMAPEGRPISDHRGNLRRRVIKSGKVVFNDGQSALDCSIRDLSEGGVRLLFPDPTIMPHVFQLHLLDGRILECELRWARGGFIGVKFRSV